jgi:hypothetical protein
LAETEKLLATALADQEGGKQNVYKYSMILKQAKENEAK